MDLVNISVSNQRKKLLYVPQMSLVWTEQGRGQSVAFGIFIFFNNLHTVLAVGAFKENLCCVGCVEILGVIYFHLLFLQPNSCQQLK